MKTKPLSRSQLTEMIADLAGRCERHEAELAAIVATTEPCDEHVLAAAQVRVMFGLLLRGPLLDASQLKGFARLIKERAA